MGEFTCPQILAPLRAAIEMLNPKTMVTTDLGQPVVNQWQDNQRREIGQQTHASKYA
jgi:hypothetical protein